MAKPLDIAFIGCGNVAWHLAPELENAGFRVSEVYSRDPSKARALQNRCYQAEVKTDLDFSQKRPDIVFLTVADKAIESVARELVLSDDTLLVHTSGSQPLHLLAFAATDKIGVFYPLQTFSTNKKVVFRDVPILVESPVRSVQKHLTSLASTISKFVKVVDEHERITIHLAAVFACNFTNHMLRISEDILAKVNLDFDLLRPLIAETLNKSLEIGPESAQTGPARRGDLEVLDRHMKLLDASEYANIYRMISQQILNLYADEE